MILNLLFFKAIEAVEEALQYKNELIKQKQLSIMIGDKRRGSSKSNGFPATSSSPGLQINHDSNDHNTDDEEDTDHHYRNVEFLLDRMGPLSGSEYKHLLGKFFLKITELRKSAHEADEMRCHLELQASDHEKQLEDARLAIIQDRFFSCL